MNPVTSLRKTHIIYDYERRDRNMGIEKAVAGFMVVMIVVIPFMAFCLTKVVDISKNNRLYKIKK